MTSEVDPEAFELFQRHGAQCNLETWDALEQHFAANGQRVAYVCDPPLLDQLFVHLKIHICPPSERHPFITLFTTGMSDRPQLVPPEREDCRFSELMMLLAPDWPGVLEKVEIIAARETISSRWGRSASGSRLFNWVQSWILNIARYPHRSGKWIGPGSLFPIPDPDPLPGTGFTGFVLLEPMSIPWALKGKDGRDISLHTLMPLYPEEMELKRKHGTEEVLRRFAARSLGEVVHPSRPNVAGTAKKGWWPFRR